MWAIKILFLCETLSTLRAFERLLSRMDFHVVIKVYFLSETFSTLFTGEWALAGVNSHVAMKVSFTQESLSTMRASKTSFRSCFQSSLFFWRVFLCHTVQLMDISPLVKS